MDKRDTFSTSPKPFVLRKFSGDWIIVVPTIIGFLLRLYNLGMKSFWLDEAVIYWISQGPIDKIISQNASINSAPPLFVLIINLISLIGHSENVLRSFSMMAGVLTIPAIYYLSKLILPKWAASISALIMAIAPLQVHYSQELREYSLSVLLAILMTLFFIKYVQEYRNKWLVYFTLTSLIGILTQYGLALLLLAVNIVFIINWSISNRQKMMILKWAIAQLLLLATVWFVYETTLKHQLIVGGFGSFYLSDGYWSTGEGVLAGIPSFFFNNTIQILEYMYPIWIPLWGALILAGVVFSNKTKELKTVLWVFFVALIATFIGGVFRLYPYVANRQLLFLSPFFYILLTLGLERLSLIRPKWVLTFVLTIIIGYVGLRSSIDYLIKPGGEELRPIVETLKGSIQPSDRIYVYYTSEPAFDYYYRGPKNPIILGIKSREEPGKYLDQLIPYLNEKNRIWLVFSHCVLGECGIITNSIATIRNVEIIQYESGAWLYLVN